MISNKKLMAGLMAFATCMTLGATAFADDWHRRGNDWNDRGHSRGHYKEKHWDRHHGDHHYRRPVVIINDSDRVVIRDYYRYRASPVVYRPVYQRWRKGYVLPHYVRYEPIPPRLLRRLHPVPVGYEYVRVDGNILLIEDASRLIIDLLRLS